MPRYTDEEKARARRLREEGATHKDVAEAIGCSERTSRLWEQEGGYGSPSEHLRLIHTGRSQHRAYISAALLDHLCAESGEHLAWRYDEGLWIAPSLTPEPCSAQINDNRCMSCVSLYETLPDRLATHGTTFIPTGDTMVDPDDPFLTWFEMEL